MDSLLIQCWFPRHLFPTLPLMCCRLGNGLGIIVPIRLVIFPGPVSTFIGQIGIAIAFCIHLLANCLIKDVGHVRNKYDINTGTIWGLWSYHRTLYTNLTYIYTIRVAIYIYIYIYISKISTHLGNMIKELMKRETPNRMSLTGFLWHFKIIWQTLSSVKMPNKNNIM